jgi:uncharacterized protein YciI
MRVAYLYFMKDQPERVAAVAPAHATYWRGLDLPGYLGGPFADRSGGLITFEADSWEKAEQLARDDPFQQQDLLRSRWVKEWTPDTSGS